MNIPEVEALTFDVFGTVVDWRNSVIRDVRKLAVEKSFSIDPEQFTLDWKAGYKPSMNRVREGERPWTKLDDLHMMVLEQLLQKYGIKSLTGQEKLELNRAWHRLDPWPDAVSGLIRLRKRYIIATLSNGNVSLLTRMAKYAHLPWDCVLSAELARHYKRDPEAYLEAAELLSLPPARIMMVAAHVGDLAAARSVGFRSAYVPRPRELGDEQNAQPLHDPEADIVANDFLDLADQLGV